MWCIARYLWEEFMDLFEPISEAGANRSETEVYSFDGL